MKTAKITFICLAAAVALSGCTTLQQVAGAGAPALKPPDPPNVRVSGVQLVSAPTNRALAMHYCPQVAGALICRLFGAPPQPAELQFSFSVELDLQNPNQIPLPAVEALIALRAYPERQGVSNFGAACIALCEEGTPCGPAPAEACTARGDQVLRTKEDYALAAANFLINTAVGNTSPSDLRFRVIPPGANITIKTQFDLGIPAMLALIKNTAGDALNQIKGGTEPTFQVPYEIEGTVWVNVEAFGKIGASFPVYAGIWNLR